MFRRRRKLDRRTRDAAPRRFGVHSRRKEARNAYTLLEVLLALALAVLVLGIIGMAIDAHVTVTERGRGKVEQAQLARSVLRLIADDLRSGIHYMPLDFSSVADLNTDADVGGLNSAAAGASGGGSGAQNGGAGGQTGGQNGGGAQPGGQTGGMGTMPPTGGATGSGGSTGAGAGGAGATSGASAGGASAGSSASDALADAAADAAPTTLPGVYGTATELEIDISRLPRVDEYEWMIQNGAGAIADIPSDVKTVAYYVAGVNGAMVSPGGPSAGDSQGGLVRRALDRAVTQFAADSGGGASLNDSGEVLAPEVTAVSFMYFDGTDWYDSWDSTDSGGPPVAIEVTIAITQTPPKGILANAWSSLTGDGSDSTTTYYRQVVHLPAAEPSSADSSPASDTSSSQSSNQSASGSSNAGGTP